MDRSSLLDRMEDQKTKEEEAVPWPPHRRRRNRTFGLICDWVLITSWCNALNSFPTSDKMQRLTPAQAAEAGALQVATRWCSAAGTAAMLLAIMLDGRRRRALTYVALSSAAANHYLATRLNGLYFVTSPAAAGLRISYVVAATAILYAVFDVLGFLALLFGVGDKEE